MRKIYQHKLLVLLFFLCLCPWSRAAEPVEIKTLKVATVAPEGLGWSKHIKNVVFPVMDEITDGKLKLKVYWGARLGDEEDYIRLMREGKLQGAGLSAQGTVLVCPQMSVLELPFLLNNYRETDYLRVKLDTYLSRLFEEKGLFLIGWIDQDFDPIFSTKYPMNKLEDFKKSRFLGWYGPMEKAMLESLGAEIVPINISGFRTAVNRGDGDAVILPSVAVIGTQTHSKFRFINPVKIRYSPASLVITMDALREMPEEYLDQIYKRRLVLGWKYSVLARGDNEKFLQALVEYGLKRADMTPGELDALKKATKNVWKKEAVALYPKELLETVSGHIEDFRAGKRLSMEELFEFSHLDETRLTPEAVRAFALGIARDSTPEMLAEAVDYLKPETSTEIIEACPEDLLIKVSKELMRQGRHELLARFVDNTSPEKINALAMSWKGPENLVQVAGHMKNREKLRQAAELFSDSFLIELLTGALRTDQFELASQIANGINPRRHKRLVEKMKSDPAIAESLEAIRNNKTRR